MKKYNLNIALSLTLLMFVVSCSTQKNTSLSRGYHNTTTKFNIYFNGSEAYKEGMQNIVKANTDDYSQILPMFPSSNHQSLSAATSNMDRTIEKSRKAIKTHSIKKKPQKNFKKWNSPKYRNWYDQTEFNPALNEAWLLLAKSEFHKGDFLGSVGTFSYIMKHYATVPDVAAEAQIWMARAYAEMNWMYEAEDVLTKLSTEKLNKKNTGLFSAAMADVLLKKKQYREAVPYLKLAIESEKNNYLKTRFKYILAQIFTLNDDKKQAEIFYSEVIKSSPPYEMEFNARINRAQLLTATPATVEKQLNKMAKNRKNKDYLDKIYGAIGNVYLNAKDTTKALTYYAKAIEKSTKNGIEKGLALVQSGDLHYIKKEYVKAEPNYNEASKIFTNDYFDYPRINKRAEVLADLVKEDNVVTLQDSLQQLAKMSETERLAVINKLIEDVKKAEEAELKKQQEKNNPNYNGNNEDEDTFSPNRMIGGNVNNVGSNWYFYNANTIKSGKADFRKNWGNRKLEDNWRRENKSAALFAENNTATVAETEAQTTDINPDDEKQEKTTADNKSVDFYLKQIPFTDKQKQKSNDEIADALFNMGFIFKDKMEDYPMAIQTFEEFEKRFPSDERVMESIYQRLLVSAKTKDNDSEEKYRLQLLSRYPNSNYAKMLSQPNFIATLSSMYKEQDSIYNQTYTAYTQSDFATVFKNTEYVKKNYPLSTLMPKFDFLNALSIGKTQKSDAFQTSLEKIVETYPQSDVSAMSKDILALMKQGNVAQLGKTHGTLLAKRTEATETDEESNAFELSANKDGKHRLMMVGNLTDSTLNKLLYSTAAFNFSRFMIKDFDMETGKINDTEKALSVTNLESYDEALWYENTLLSDKEMAQMMQSMQIKLIPISEDNFGKLKTLFTLNQYLDFQKEKLTKSTLVAQNATPKKTTDKTTVADKTTKTTAAKKETAKSQDKPKNEVKKQEEVPTKKQDETTQKQETKQTEAVESDQTKNVTQNKEEAKPLPEPEKAKVEEPKIEEPVAWFKNTYAYRPNAPHFVALYVPSGGVPNFAKIQQVFDKYNAENYGMLNLKVSLENLGKQQTIIIGSFVDANTAKSYLLRMLKEQTIIEATKGVNRRNLIGTQENLNIMVQKNDLNTYFEFMKEFYLK